MEILQSQLTEKNSKEISEKYVIIVKAYRKPVYDLISLNHYRI